MPLTREALSSTYLAYSSAETAASAQFGNTTRGGVGIPSVVSGMSELLNFSDKPFDPTAAPVVGSQHLPLTERYKSRYADLIDARGRFNMHLYEPAADPFKSPMRDRKAQSYASQQQLTGTVSRPPPEDTPFELFVEPSDTDTMAVATTVLARAGKVPSNYIDSVPVIKRAIADYGKSDSSIVSVLSATDARPSTWEPSDAMVTAAMPASTPSKSAAHLAVRSAEVKKTS